MLDRDARAKRVLATSLSPAELVERATNGITFANDEGVEAVILIPSVVIRPFVVITDHTAGRMFGYSVDEEFLTGDDDAPPTWLVDFYKAIGDDKRLRILTVLAQGETTLGTLVDRLDLAKSTVHQPCGSCGPQGWYGSQSVRSTYSVCAPEPSPRPAPCSRPISKNTTARRGAAGCHRRLTF